MAPPKTIVSAILAPMAVAGLAGLGTLSVGGCTRSAADNAALVSNAASSAQPMQPGDAAPAKHKGPSAGRPSVEFRLASAATLNEDASLNHLVASLAGGACVDGRDGKCLKLDGSGGLEVSNAPPLSCAQGFTIDTWVNFSAIENGCVAAKEGEFLLRIDPVGEGGRLSFFVNSGNAMEPRLSTLTPKTGTWYHLIASWDGNELMMAVNEFFYRSAKAGTLSPTQNPLLVGKASQHAGNVKGMISDFRFYNAAVNPLLPRYGLNLAFEGKKTEHGSFDFSQGMGNWKAIDCGACTVKDGLLAMELTGPESALANNGLDVLAAPNEFISVIMSATKGAKARILILSTVGSKTLDFPIKADGQMHQYLLPVLKVTEWSGKITGLAFSPADAAGQVALASIRFLDAKAAPTAVKINYFFPDVGVSRAGRPVKILADLSSFGGPGKFSAKLVPGDGVIVLGSSTHEVSEQDTGKRVELSWMVQTEKAGERKLKLVVSAANMEDVTAEYTVPFTPPVAITKGYIPEPVPIRTKVLVGAQNCPLWEDTRMWKSIDRDLWRMPVLGKYDELNPEVKDWETKWAVDHGIDFMVYCWYRTRQGSKDIHTMFERCITEGLYKSKYVNQMKFAIMWENQSRNKAGVSDEKDLLENLLPYWIDTFFKHPSYLKIDGKPLLFIYVTGPTSTGNIYDDLGGAANVNQAFEKMREICHKAGFAGLTILGEYRGTDRTYLDKMKEMGFDYQFSYCNGGGGMNPTPEQAVAAQEKFWATLRDLNAIPQILTLSMGWTGWQDEGSIWKIPPAGYETLCRKALAFTKTMPQDELGSKMVLLDNWNEWGEGHYLAPYREYGMGYLDAVRNAFSDAPKNHVDLIPEDLGLGPYAVVKKKTVAVKFDKEAAARSGADKESGLLAWWRFDEGKGTTAGDLSGYGRHGKLSAPRWVTGVSGTALAFDGSANGMHVDGSEGLVGLEGFTVSMWIKVKGSGKFTPFSVNMLTRLYLDDSASHFAMSTENNTWYGPGSVCAFPALPKDKWVHVAVSYDKKAIQVYLDGELAGTSTGTSGKPESASAELTIGLSDAGGLDDFIGEMDEVRMYDRALSAGKIEALSAARGK